MDRVLRIILCFFALSSFSYADDETPLEVATDYSAFIFNDFNDYIFKAFLYGDNFYDSGESRGAIAVGGDFSVYKYNVAKNEDVQIPNYSLLIEGNARFRYGKVYRGKVRVQGDTSKIRQSVIDDFPSGSSLENTILDFSIKALQPRFITISNNLNGFDITGRSELSNGVLTFKGEQNSALQVFEVDGGLLEDANKYVFENIPELSTVIINVLGSKIDVIDKDFSSLTPHSNRIIFNFFEAEQIELRGVSFAGTILAPNADIEGIKGQVMGSVLANSWAGKMKFGGSKFKGKWPLNIDVTSPNTLITVGYSPITVSGSVTGNLNSLTLNGVPVSVSNQTQFSADVTLKEGFNTIVARATSQSGSQVTDSIVVSLDLTPPYLTIDSHMENQTVYSDHITVTGLVNDIVRGTVEAEQAAVEINGIKATVSNRSYAAKDIPLTEGENTLTVSSIDQAGNSSSITRVIFYKVPTGRRIILVSGQDQVATITEQAANKLKVKVVDANSLPVSGESVVFRVIQGAGVVGDNTSNYGRAVVIETDENGIAETAFQLGYRAGVANHKVRVKVVGYENEVIFHASAESMIGNKISVNSGNNLRGIIGQNLPAPFVVTVTDSGANTVKGARVRFNVIKGGGVFQNEESSFETQTDGDGRASAQLLLGELAGIDAQRVQAILLDAPAGKVLTAGFMATGFIAGDPGKTSVTGVVLDNQDQPIPDVTVRIENTDRTTVTDVEGQFKIEQVPVGPIHLIADGSTARYFGEYPTLSYHLVTVAGVENPLSSPIYMVKLDTENTVSAGSEDVILTLDDFPGFKLEIEKDSITFPDGSREGLVSVTAVNASKVPMAPPNGMQPQFIVTIQPVGAVFDPPAKLSLPNVDGHTPGAQVEMYSFDHDLEEFVSIGLGTVSEDGSVVKSNPGVGVIKAGWHCGSQPGGSGTAHNCPDCKKCEGDVCVNDSSQNKKPLKKQVDGDCKTLLCVGSTPAPGDIPKEDKPNDCKKPGCVGDSPEQIPDDYDITEDDKKCSSCSDGKKVKDPNKEDQACGGSDPSKACYTCKDGSCGNQCGAEADKIIVSYSLAFSSELMGLIDKIQAHMPFITIQAGGSFDHTTIDCEKCCKDCSLALGTQKYTNTIYSGKGTVDFKAFPPVIAYVAKMPRKEFVGFSFSGDVEFGPGVKGSVEATATGVSEDSACETGKCQELTVGVKGTLSPGFYAGVTGKLESCELFDPDDCNKLLGVASENHGKLDIYTSLSVKKFKGDSCASDGCHSWDIGAVDYSIEASFIIELAGVYKNKYSYNLTRTLAEGLKGGSCD